MNTLHKIFLLGLLAVLPAMSFSQETGKEKKPVKGPDKEAPKIDWNAREMHAQRAQKADSLNQEASATGNETKGVSLHSHSIHPDAVRTVDELNTEIEALKDARTKALKLGENTEDLDKQIATKEAYRKELQEAAKADKK